MYDIYCPTHRSRVLLGARSIAAIDNTPDGIVVHLRCSCGTTSTLRTGRRARARDAVAQGAASVV